MNYFFLAKRFEVRDKKGEEPDQPLNVLSQNAKDGQCLLALFNVVVTVAAH
jgi:hypothetical protein